MTTQLEYTQRGDVAIERTALDGVSYSVEYAYDASGNRTRTTAPSGIAGESAFAGLRPASLSILAAPRVEILRDIEWYPFGPRKTALFPPADATEANTVRSRREINLRGQVSEVVVERLDVTPPVPVVHRRYDHRYDDGAPGPDDPGPNLDQMTDLLDPTQSRFFFYDALDRLHTATDPAGAVVHEYTHDAVGNRASQSSAGGSTAYVYQSGTNRLDATTGAEVRDYAHDAYGNRIYDGPANEGVPPSLFYDDSNRLVQVKDPANGFATLATYTYDAFGRGIKKVAGEGTTLFFYDTEGHLILEVDKRPTADASRTYVYLEDELVGLVERQKEVGVTAWLPPVAGPIEIDPRLALWLVVGAAGLGVGLATRRASPGLATVGSGAALFLLCAGASPTPRVTWVDVDPLGTPIAVTNSLGTWDPANPAKVIWRASHEPFGQALLDEDPDGNGALFTLNVRFPGQYADAETGWHYNFFRTYDPGTGRYLEVDPLGLTGRSTYEYAFSNPLRYIDPLGLIEMNWFPPGSTEFNNASQIGSGFPVYGFAGHGNPSSVSDPQDSPVGPLGLSDAISRDPAWGGRPVVLYSCNTGRGDDPFAQLLADALGVLVMAPDNFGSLPPPSSLSRFLIAPPIGGDCCNASLGSDCCREFFDGIGDKPRPDLGNPGRWRVFIPRGNPTIGAGR